MKIPRVVGLPVGEALRALDAGGFPAAEIENVSVPADFSSRRPADNRRKAEYVAVSWVSPGGRPRLRVVSVPDGPKDTAV